MKWIFIGLACLGSAFLGSTMTHPMSDSPTFKSGWEAGFAEGSRIADAESYQAGLRDGGGAPAPICRNEAACILGAGAVAAAGFFAGVLTFYIRERRLAKAQVVP